MANGDLQSELLNVVQGGVPERIDQLRNQMAQLTSVATQQLFSVRQNTDALAENTSSRGTAANAANVAKDTATGLGFGLLLSPLITGLTKLFGRDSSVKEEPALTPFTRPSAVSFEAAIGPGASSFLSPVDSSQDGSARRVISSGTQPPTQQNVTIQIQALDSRSIMDRSEDIARAVREAMLNSHSVNDVIAEM